MSTQTDKIKAALTTLADVATLNNWPMIHSQATEALSELESHPQPAKVLTEKTYLCENKDSDDANCNESSG